MKRYTVTYTAQVAVDFEENDPTIHTKHNLEKEAEGRGLSLIGNALVSIGVHAYGFEDDYNPGCYLIDDGVRVTELTGKEQRHRLYANNCHLMYEEDYADSYHGPCGTCRGSGEDTLMHMMHMKAPTVTFEAPEEIKRSP